MNDVSETQSGKGDSEDEESSKRRLEELKKARNEMLENMDPSMGGGADDSTLRAEGGDDNDAEQLAANGIVHGEADKKEVSAATIGRMMGLVTLSEFKLVENKVDLLSTRMNSILVKMDKVLSTLESAPTGSDLDRIDVQIGSLKTMLKEAVTELKGSKAEQSAERVSDARILSSND